MVRGFRETWVFINNIRNDICTRKMCSVVWHLEGCSVFLFSAHRKSVSNVSATKNMEQQEQEQKLMQGGDFVIVIQLTSLEDTLPLPRFLPRNLLNKERLQYEGQERGRIFLLPTWDRHESCPANINQSSLPFPSTHLLASGAGGSVLGQPGEQQRGQELQGSQSWALCPSCQLPSPPCTAGHWHFQGDFHSARCPQSTCPQPTLQTWSGLCQEDQGFPGWASCRGLRGQFGNNSRLLQSSVKDHVWRSVSMGFSGEELPYSPWHQPLLCRGKIPARTLWWCLEFCSRQAHSSNITLKYLLGSYSCNFQKRQKQRFL